MATRALTYLMEALPNTCPMLIHMGAVPLLCSKLLVIAYDTIDVAEQALSVPTQPHAHCSQLCQ